MGLAKTNQSPFFYKEKQVESMQSDPVEKNNSRLNVDVLRKETLSISHGAKAKVYFYILLNSM